ncbi:MAG: hypothetical protein EOO01_30320, partial [Chitinophagaceae bacterium]
MLQLFRNYSPFTVLILIIAGFLMKLQALSSGVAPVPLPDHIIFGQLLAVLNHIFHGSAFGYTLFAVVLLHIQAIYLNYITVKHKLFHRNTYLPAFSYLVLTSIYPPFNYFSEPLLINFFTIAALDLMLTLSQTSQPRKQIFNAGFLLCIPAMIQFPAVGFILLLFLALLFLRTFNLGEWTVGGLGYLTPIYFFVAFLFLFDQLPAIYRLPHFGFAFPKELNYP